MDVAFSTISSSILGSGVLLLPSLAVALLYAHGRYLPIWLPDLGLLGAYLMHAMWSRGLHPVWASGLALLVTAVLGAAIHRWILGELIETKDTLACLLLGVGLSVIFQSMASIYGKGMSQHYPRSFLHRQAFSDAIGATVHRADLACLVALAATILATWLFLRMTHWGLRVQAVIANRDLARHFVLPVGRVDGIVVSVATSFAVLGALFRGIRYDLQPQMMFYPGLFAITGCVAAGPGRLYTPLALILLMEVLAGLVGTVPSISPLRRAVPFAVLLAVLIVRTLLARSKSMARGWV